MRPEDFKHLLTRFKGYVAAYLSENTDESHTFRLKEKHSYRVCSNIALLSRDLDLAPEDVLLAKTMAILHDLGRFEQYRRFRTFNDRISENHAALSVAQIEAHRLLSACRGPEAGLVTGAIAVHNAARLPQGPDERTLFFMRLLRDADKLDIWRVFRDYYRTCRERPLAALRRTIVWDLPDRPEWSAAVIAALREGRHARTEDLRTLNDFKLLQISWIYDLNFRPAFRILRRRGYLQSIAAELPQETEISQVVEKSLAFVKASACPCQA